LAKTDTAFQGASVGQPTEPCLASSPAKVAGSPAGAFFRLSNSGRKSIQIEVA
jgi:hypothetical protein